MCWSASILLVVAVSLTILQALEWLACVALGWPLASGRRKSYRSGSINSAIVICFLACWCSFFLAAYFSSENCFIHSLKIIFLRAGPEMQFWSNHFSCHFALFCLLQVGVCRWQWRGRIKVPWCCGCCFAQTQEELGWAENSWRGEKRWKLAQARGEKVWKRVKHHAAPWSKNYFLRIILHVPIGNFRHPPCLSYLCKIWLDHVGMCVCVCLYSNRERERGRHPIYYLHKNESLCNLHVMTTMSSSWETDATLLAMAARVATRAASFGVGGTLAAADAHIKRSIQLWGDDLHCPWSSSAKFAKFI